MVRVFAAGALQRSLTVISNVARIRVHQPFWTLKYNETPPCQDPLSVNLNDDMLP